MAVNPNPPQYTEQFLISQRLSAAQRTSNPRPITLLRGALAAVIVAGACVSGSATAARAEDAPSRAAISAPKTPLELYLQLIETLYRLFGGDPAELYGLTVAQATVVVCNYYYAHGIPTNLTSQQHAELVDVVSDLMATDALPAAELGATVTEYMRKTLEDIWADLNP